MKGKIDKLIINAPYEEPKQYWEYIRGTREFMLQESRRPARYIVASESTKAFDDPGAFIETELVNAIRPRGSSPFNNLPATADNMLK